jgi:hypothetical protein
MKVKKSFFFTIVLLCFCSTPMRHYLEEPPKTSPQIDSSAVKKSDTVSLDIKKKTLCLVAPRLER